MEQLHFKIGDGLDILARNGYWFEDRKEWAIELIKNLCFGISDKQIHDVLNGDAKILGKGDYTELVYEEDLEFKEKLKEHLEFLKQQKIKEEFAKKRAKFCQDTCGNSDCRYCSGHKCCFGMISQWGCYANNESKIDKQIDFTVFMRRGALASNQSHAFDLVNDMTIAKVFDFDFENHHYTINDSARNQSECPHCGERSKGVMWNNKEDKESFLGTKELARKQFAWCFECPKCFKKFFYHNTMSGENAQ
jgi:hypothetical protein